MKVTRKQLFKKLIPFFEEEMGYTYFKDTILAYGGIFIRYWGLCLCLLS